MKNQYFVMRHGESKANALGIIVSDPNNGVPDYGLTEKGEWQATASAQKVRDLFGFDSSTVIYSSDFKRAKETAEKAKVEWETETDIVLTPALRERFFGDWELKSNEHYEDVWAEDHTDPNHTNHNAEPINAVVARILKLIEEIEGTYENKKVVLVAHGDIAQILLAYAMHDNPGGHRSLEHVDTAEIREVKFT